MKQVRISLSQVWPSSLASWGQQVCRCFGDQVTFSHVHANLKRLLGTNVHTALQLYLGQNARLPRGGGSPR